MKLYVTSDKIFQQLPREAGLQFSTVAVPKSADFLYGFCAAHDEAKVLAWSDEVFEELNTTLKRRAGTDDSIGALKFFVKVDLNDIVQPRAIARLDGNGFEITDWLLVLNIRRRGWELMRMS